MPSKERSVLHTFDDKHLLKINGRVPEHNLKICNPTPTVPKEEPERSDKSQMPLPLKEAKNAKEITEARAEEGQ